MEIDSCHVAFVVIFISQFFVMTAIIIECFSIFIKFLKFVTDISFLIKLLKSVTSIVHIQSCDLIYYLKQPLLSTAFV